MSISALSSSNAASQLSAFSRLGGSSSTSNTSGSVDGARPPKSDDGAFLDAIGSALSSIGVTVDAGEGGSDTATSENGASSDVGQALGAFLHQLMGSLHAQGGSAGGHGEDGEPPSGPPPGGGARAGGPGNIEADLQSLLQKLASTGSDAGDSTESSVTDLPSSFASLLSALGGDEGSSGSGSSKLSSFLQALSGSLGTASAGGSLSASGNLVNTTA